MKITPLQQGIAIGFAGLIAILFVYYQVAIKPINKDIVSLQSTLDQKKKDLEEAKRIVAKYVEFKKRQDSVQRELEWIQNRIPKTIERSQLIEAISFLQNRSGVFMTNLQFQPPAVSKEGGYVEIPAVITFNTDFDGLLRFIYQISLSRLFMTVHDLKVKGAADQFHPNVTLTAQMVLSGIQAK